MDSQLLIIWISLILVALGLDLAAYIFLRRDWKKNGITLTDRFWNQLFAKLSQLDKMFQNRIAIALVKYHQDSMSTPPAPIPAPAAVPNAIPVEIIPVSVEHIGLVRRVQFSIDMPLDTQVEVRIGATREAGVTVEKREL